MGKAGLVIGLEVSRLARNNADWQRLLEICALTETLILDEDGLYDPCAFNDRMLLGLKGTLSEAELHFLKARLRGGQLLQGPQRGADHALACRPGLRRRRPGRAGPRPGRARRGDAPVRHLRPHRLGSRHRQGIRRRRARVPVPDTHRPEQGHARLATPRPSPGAAGPAQPPLCRGVRLWTPPPAPRTRRPDPPHPPAARVLDRADPRRAPRIHQLGHLRGQPPPPRRVRPVPRRPTAGPARHAKDRRCCRAWRSAAAAGTA